MSVIVDDASIRSAEALVNGVALAIGKPVADLLEGCSSAATRSNASIFLLPSMIVLPYATNDDAAEFFHRLD